MKTGDQKTSPAVIDTATMSLPDQEASYRRMAEESPVILWMTGPDSRSNFFNRRWYEFTGLPPAELQGGKAWLQALHPDDRDRCLETIHSAMSAHRPMELTYRLQNRDGDYSWMLDKSRPCYGDDGRFLGYVGATIDISERRAMEEALARSNAELRRANQDSDRLRAMNDHLLVCRNAEEINAVLLHFAPKLFGDSHGAIFIINESRSLMEAVVQWGDCEIENTAFVREDCWALRQGKEHRVTLQEGVACAHLSDIPRHDYMCIPLIAHGDVLGSLYLSCQSGDEDFIESRYRFARTATENLSLALSSFKLREALRYQSARDPLTKLFNRRYMMESLEREIARARRRGQSIAVVMIDIDHFKQFNDTHGHLAGYAALKAVGKTLMRNLRTEDIACRYGGEEFLLVLTDIDEKNALRRVEELRQAIAGLNIEFQNRSLGLFTMSAGIALYPAHGEDTDTLLERADQALYKAKHEGRDRVCLASLPDEPNSPPQT